jgi:hypothetical protein
LSHVNSQVLPWRASTLFGFVHGNDRPLEEIEDVVAQYIVKSANARCFIKAARPQPVPSLPAGCAETLGIADLVQTFVKHPAGIGYS